MEESSCGSHFQRNIRRRGIVAAAIGGNHRGDVVGERTFGSASHQKLIEFDDGSAVVLTDSLYYTPDNKSIVEEGVAPTTEASFSTEYPAAFSRAENPLDDSSSSRGRSCAEQGA